MTCAFVPLKPNELTPWPGPPRPRDGLGRHADRQLVPRDVRVQRPDVQMRRNTLVLKRERDFDQTGNPGRRLEVADIGLHRADDKRGLRVAAFTHHARQRVDLDRIAEWSAGAMRLDILQLAGLDIRGRQRPSDDRLLCGSIRRGQAIAAPVLVHRRAANHREDRIPAIESVRQPLEHDDRAAFRAHVAVGSGIKRLATPIGRHHARLRQVDVDLGRQDQVDATGEREVALARSQAVAREVNADQRRRTRSINREAWTLQAEKVRQATSGDAEGRTERVVRIDARLVGTDQAAIVAVAHPDEHTALTACEIGRRDPRVFQRFPGGFEHQPVLGIHARCLAGRNAEEMCVEPIHILQEAAVANRHSSWCVAVRVKIRVPIPSFGRYFDDRVTPLVQQPPETVDVHGTAGKAQADPHDRNRLACRPLRLGEPDAHAAQLDDGALDRRRVATIFAVAHFVHDSSVASSSARSSASASSADRRSRSLTSGTSPSSAPERCAAAVSEGT
jgi:hypothetical protein